MPPEPGEQERHALIRRLEREYKDAEAKLRKASHDHSLARVERHNAEARLFRVQSPPDANNFCLLCWVNHQRLSYLRPVPAPETRLVDQWRCEADDCGHTEDRRTGARPGTSEETGGTAGN
jgi:hypothetical protein